MSKPDPFAVRQIKGPFIKLPLHPHYCSSEAELLEYAENRRKNGALLGADLFAGAGGLSEGLGQAGIEVILGVDHYPYAVETHAARFPGMSTNWDLSTSENVQRVADLMKNAGIDVLAGGPPCQPFSKAGRAGIRYLVERGERDPIDQRRNLWRAYLEVVQLAQPRAVIMENVPDIALDKEMFILRSMVTELEQMGYSVEGKVVDAWRYGVPQFRQRFILVALRDGISFEWPNEQAKKVSVWNAIGDLPEIEGGARPTGEDGGWWRYNEPITSFQREMRKNVSLSMKHRIYDHITRPVREDDRKAFEQMTASTKYSDLPAELRRYRSDIFNDKYKRLDENDLSRTITAHIAKDGYGFIHPRQPRTISVREAARLQTFPDDFRFSGPPSAAFKQIGNAVPVRLGKSIGEAVVEALGADKKKSTNANWTCSALASWYKERPTQELIYPWLRGGTRWHIVIAETFLVRSTMHETRFVWPLIRQTQVRPGEQVPPEAVDLIMNVFAGERFRKRRTQFARIVDDLNRSPHALWSPKVDREELPAISPSLAELIELAVPVTSEADRSEEPVIVAKGVLRVTSRYLGIDTETRNKQTNGRISVGTQLVLQPSARFAHLALFEVARQLCTPERPRCELCPLRIHCQAASKEPNHLVLVEPEEGR